MPVASTRRSLPSGRNDTIDADHSDGRDIQLALVPEHAQGRVQPLDDLHRLGAGRNEIHAVFALILGVGCRRPQPALGVEGEPGDVLSRNDTCAGRQRPET